MVRINLLPREEKPSGAAVVWSKIFVWALVGAALVLIIGAGLHIFRYYEISSLKSDIKEAVAEQEKYREQAALVDALTTKRREITQRINVVESLDQNRRLGVHLLDELARSVPEYVWLQRFQEKGGAAQVKGWAFSNLAISRFMDALEAKTHTDSVYLRVIRKEDMNGTPVLGFDLGYHVKTQGEAARGS
jgi:type IV pilus assembly protein PilN